MEDYDLSNVEGDVFQHHRRLVRWITQDNDGYLHPDVRIAHNAGKGFHMVVASAKTIQAHTRVTSSPMTATLSVLNALDIPPFRPHGPKFPLTFLRKNAKKPELLQNFFLMEQYLLGERSWWAPYIKTLPDTQYINSLQFDSQHDQLWLEGTNLKSAFIAQTTKWQEMYTSGLRDLKILNWQPALDGRYSWELFRWAATIFGSRSFTSEVLTDTEPADQVRMEGRNGVHKSEHEFLKPLFVERFAVLLPLLDILNHKPVAQVEWQARCSFVGMQVLSSFSSGEELCNNYGPRDNEGLLLSYGFTIQDNPFDHVSIALKPPPAGSPLATARKEWKLDIRSTLEYRLYIFDMSHPRARPDSASCLESTIFSYDLLDALSILKGNDRELQTMYLMQQSLMSLALAKPHKFDDFRNLLSVLSQLYLDCKVRAEKLKTTYPLSSPQNTKQKHAKVYRDRQLSIVESATAVCELVLARACSERAQDKMVADLQHHTSWPAFNNLKALLKLHTVITRPHELLTFEKIAEFLPDHKLLVFRIVLEEIETQLSSNCDQPSAIPLQPPAPTSPTKRKRSPPQPQPQARQSETLVTNERHNDDRIEAALPAAAPSTRPLSASITQMSKDPIALTKTRLSLLLAIYLHFFLTGHLLPLRLRSWLEQLTSWYPPEDPNWSYVPHQGPWNPGEEPPMGLVKLLKARREVMELWQRKMRRHEDLEMGNVSLIDGLGNSKGMLKAKTDTWEKVQHWFTSERICWGWNVMEEEGLVVSTDILKLADMNSEGSGGGNDLLEHKKVSKEVEEVDFLLYCKQ